MIEGTIWLNIICYVEKVPFLRTYMSMLQKILVRLQSIKQCTYWLWNISILTESHCVSFETRFTEKIIRYRLPSGPERAKSEVCFKTFVGNLDVQMSLTLLLSYSAQNFRSFYRRIRKKIYYSDFFNMKNCNFWDGNR